MWIQNTGQILHDKTLYLQIICITVATMNDAHDPSCTECCIHAEHLSFRFNGQDVLRDVHFSIRCGEYVGIVGPNGGGKTTLLKLILGLLPPTSGEISIDGKRPVDARRGGKIGYVPQRLMQADFLFPATVEEVVQSGHTRLFSFGRDKKNIDAALHSADITHLRHRQIGTLSGGERQRVFIARALAGNPHMLILDEPTTGVDPGARDRFYAFLRDLNEKKGLTILFVTHDVDVMTVEAKSILCVNQTVLCHVPAKTFAHDASLRDLYGEHVSRIPHHHH